MIGILLTILAVVLYINGNKKWSILLFACFSYRGFVVLTDNETWDGRGHVFEYLQESQFL